MPRKLKVRRRTTGWNDEHRAALLSHDYFDVFQDEAHERNAWEALRDELLPAWIARHPGTRCRAWWRFDAPGRRSRIDGGIHPHDDPTFDLPRELYMGKPRLQRECDIDAEYESQEQFLRRHSMLDDAELQELEKEDR